MKFIESIKNVWKIEELRNRIIVALSMLLVYRFGAQVVLPGIDASQLGGLSDSAVRKYLERKKGQTCPKMRKLVDIFSD